MAFQYESNLPHQEKAINAVVATLQEQDFLEQRPNSTQNPLNEIDKVSFANCIDKIQKANDTQGTGTSNKPILDIEMVTGTGKTYTYTKTMFELHHNYGLFKFVVIVPGLSIKAGTENFLNSTALAQHFKLDFEGKYDDTEIELYVLQSQQKKKSQSSLREVERFSEASDKSKIHVLLTNMQMLHSDSMEGKKTDGSQLIAHLFETPFEAIANTRPVVIIDEPHRFSQGNKTWPKIEKLKPLLILRYGATFKANDDKSNNKKVKKSDNENSKYENLIYRLTPVQAFNANLVKGVNVFVETLEGDDGTNIRLENARQEQAEFSLGEKSIVLRVGDNLGMLHPNLDHLFIAGSKKDAVLLSNDLTLTKGDKLNPFSFNSNIVEKMLRIAIREHFDTEKKLLTRQPRIKPLTLFFIDDIKGYREGRGVDDSLLTRFEKFVEVEVQKRLEKETDPFYRAYLEKALTDISATHGGYFAQDNSESDEKIEQEIQEILHDKEELLSLQNPRRFIFSKWTLREGWDNPNVFGICKLRTSGSEESKIQEVGRGLRLPVNEHMARVNGTGFYLNYFVDSREQDFVDTLVQEVNDSSVLPMPSEFTPEIIQDIISSESTEAVAYNENNEFLDAKGKVISHQEAYSQYQQKLGKHKVRNGNQATKKKVRMRLGKYEELRTLWENLNQKVILQYNIKDEAEFLELFKKYLKSDLGKFKQGGSRTVQSKLEVQGKSRNKYLVAIQEESIEQEDFEPIAMMSYSEFLRLLSEKTLIQRNTLHSAFLAISGEVDIRAYLNKETIKGIASNFNNWLLMNSFGEFQVGYQHVSNQVHPTKFTDEIGNPREELDASIFDGEIDEYDQALEQFLFDTIFYNSKLEKENMVDKKVKSVVVFTKIPKKSIQIPISGGATYSPDFAYVVKTEQGDILNLVIETKGVKDENQLRKEESKKIEHAKKLFSMISQEINVKFKTQFNDKTIKDIIIDALDNNS